MKILLIPVWALGVAMGTAAIIVMSAPQWGSGALWWGLGVFLAQVVPVAVMSNEYHKERCRK